MKFVPALVIKFALQLALFALLLPLAFNLSIASLVDTVVVIWIATLMIGDMLVLPAAGPAVAAVVDLILVMLALVILVHAVLTWALFGIALAVAAVEFFYHDALLARGVVSRGARV